MRTPHRRRSRAYLDRVLDGNAGGSDPLIGLVEQLQAAPRRRETRGLRAASSAFAWAPSVRPYLPPHHRTGLSSTAATVWHPKVLIAALTLIVATPIAVASAETLSDQRSPASVTISGIAAQMSAQSSASVNPARSPVPRQTPPVAPVLPPTGATGSSVAGTAPATATTDVAVLAPWCRQWLALPSSAKVGGNPIFKLLTGVAGGPAAIDSYCSTLLHVPAPSSAPAGPRSSARPSPDASDGTSAPASPTATPTPTPTS